MSGDLQARYHRFVQLMAEAEQETGFTVTVVNQVEQTLEGIHLVQSLKPVPIVNWQPDKEHDDAGKFS